MADFERLDLVVRGLRKRIGDFLLEADFFVRQGERAALVGRSGSGKTTLLRALAGLESIDAGKIELGAEDLTSLAPRMRAIGFVFQEQALFPSMTVLENVTFPLKLRKIPKAQAVEQALSWLEKVDLRKLANASIQTLSGGERQRVAFVRALIWKPRLLLLDEPFSALDRELRSGLCRELLEVHRIWPVPMVLVSHDERDVESVASVRLNLTARARQVPGEPELIHSIVRQSS